MVVLVSAGNPTAVRVPALTYRRRVVRARFQDSDPSAEVSMSVWELLWTVLDQHMKFDGVLRVRCRGVACRRVGGFLLVSLAAVQVRSAKEQGRRVKTA